MTFDINNLWPYELRKGNSASPREGACTMDAVSWLAYGHLGDYPECASPALSQYVIIGNDAMPHYQRQRLKPYIFRLMGSRDDNAELPRARHLAMAAVRVFTPRALESAGLPEVVARLRTATKANAADAVFTAASIANAAFAAANAADVADAAASVADTACTSAANAAWCAARAADAAASSTDIWDDYLKALDEALNLGKQGGFDFDPVARLREFKAARNRK